MSFAGVLLLAATIGITVRFVVLLRHLWRRRFGSVARGAGWFCLLAVASYSLDVPPVRTPDGAHVAVVIPVFLAAAVVLLVISELVHRVATRTGGAGDHSSANHEASSPAPRSRQARSIAGVSLDR